MYSPPRPFHIAIFAFLLAISTACKDDVGQGPSGDCPDDQCVTCEGHGDCDAGTYCDEDQGVCVEALCTPGTNSCDGSSTITCNAVGDAYLEPVACDTEVCVDGQCGCADEGDCGLGEDCAGGLCVCASAVQCGDDRRCCDAGESCNHVNICDGGQCDVVSLCQPQCDGAVCGASGELCCEGETPQCGPTGQCAPSCEGQGELCGDDFDICCPSGDVCVFGDCRTPGAPCQGFSECDFGQYCDLGLERCMPDEFPDGLVCEIDYDFEEFEPDVLWHWLGVEIDGTMYSNVMMTPVVADMNGDGTPNVAFNAYDQAGASQNSYPVVIDGDSGETIYFNSTRHTQFATQLALVHITDADYPEIVAAHSNGVGVIRNIVDCPDPDDDPDGCYLWWNGDVSTSEGSPVVADMNADGNVEVILNDTILNGETGDVIAVSPSGGYDYTVVADITGDGKLEFLAGGCLYALTDDDEEPLDELWCNAAELPGGSGPRVYVAVGDVVEENGRAGLPEFVITGDSNVYVVAAESGAVLHDFELPGGGSGGSPIIADFDGDGSAEFGIAGQGCYTVFDVDCLGPADEDLPGCERPTIDPCESGVDCFDVQACPDLEATGGTGDGILWSVYIQDISSSRTGSSVFDFMGNGRNEVVYNDECLLMVFDGQTGSPQFRFPNTNRTSSEYPIIVDVNGDSRTNIVVSANNDRFERDCEDPIQDRPDRFPECHGDGPFPTWCTEGTHGVIALQDPEDRWVRTRSIWNQFAYHIDNVTDDARSPTSPAMPWESHNTFRANRQGEVPLNAPDVVVSSVQVSTLSCPPDLDFQVTVQNLGMSGIPSGLPVSLYSVDLDERLETVNIPTPISPGGTVVLEFSWEVPTGLFNQSLSFQVIANDDGSAASLVWDCNPETAQAVVGGVVCRYTL